MIINVKIEVDDDDRSALAAALGCAEDKVEEELGLHGRAAVHEYAEAYAGRRALTRGTDILEHRLALLIQHAFKEKIPSDADISRLFQTPIARSRTLLRNALSHYRYQLREATTASVRTVLENATWRADRSLFQVEFHAANLLELMNIRLAGADARKKPVAKSADSVATYEIAEQSYELLCELFGAEPKSKT